MDTIKQLLPYALVVLVVAVGGFMFITKGTPNSEATPQPSTPNPDGTFSMVLEETGYVPKTLVIPKGSTVVFSTTRDTYHWPASNLHPNHEIYSEFDPKKPVAPEDTWSFTFDQVGHWNLHDHLRSYYRGRIIVFE